MIEVQYFEEQFDLTLQAIKPVLLGKEIYADIEEVLLPQKSPAQPAAVFMTKKFFGHPEYRWEVDKVVIQPPSAGAPQKFDITLIRRNQLDKNEYLTQILNSPGKSIASVLHRFALVEVEYGHPLIVGKADGKIRSNKRYPDTLQAGSMRKRRLAVVNRVVASGYYPMVQVVPISSKAPLAGDASRVEVTNSLVNMTNYQERSWAVCSMIETVPATRIIAPVVRWNGGRGSGRDTGFKNKLQATDRQTFEDALMHGVESSIRVKDTAASKHAGKTIAKKEQEIEALDSRVKELEDGLRHLSAYKEMAADFAKAMGRNTQDCVNEYLEMWPS